MKILIVDDHADTKCVGIMEQCKERKIEVKVAKASKEATFIICSDEGKTLDGIVLDMNLPLSPDDNNIKEREGENILRHLSRRNINIPVLVFSDTQMNSNYVQVFDKMMDWNKEGDKFLQFLEKIQKEKELEEQREELQKIKEQGQLT